MLLPEHKWIQKDHTEQKHCGSRFGKRQGVSVASNALETYLHLKGFLPRLYAGAASLCRQLYQQKCLSRLYYFGKQIKQYQWSHAFCL